MLSGFTHCKCCGVKLSRSFDTLDGLCSHQKDGYSGCFHRWRRWLRSRAECPEDIEAIAYSDPVCAVSIDQWLEAGAP